MALYFFSVLLLEMALLFAINCLKDFFFCWLFISLQWLFISEFHLYLWLFYCNNGSFLLIMALSLFYLLFPESGGSFNSVMALLRGID